MNSLRKKIRQAITGSLLVALVALTYGSLLSPLSAHALTPNAPSTYAVLAPLPCIASNDSNGNAISGCDGSTLQTNVDFESYVQNTVNLAIALSSVLAIFMIVWGGFEYITSTIPGTKSDGLNKVKNAVIGLILVLCSYIIIRTIDPRLVQIPTNLVPKLTLNSKLTQPTTQDFLNQLENEANQYNDDDHAARQALDAAKAAAAQGQTKLDDLNKQINTQLGNPPGPVLSDDEIEHLCLQDQVDGDLCSQRQDVEDQISNAVSTAAQQRMNGVFNRALANVSTDPATANAQLLQSSLDSINQAYKNDSPGIANPAQQQAVDSQYNFTKAQLEIQQAYLATNQSSGKSVDAGIANIKNILNTDILKITDPDQKTKATTAANQAIQEMQDGFDRSINASVMMMN